MMLLFVDIFVGSVRFNDFCMCVGVCVCVYVCILSRLSRSRINYFFCILPSFFSFPICVLFEIVISAKRKRRKTTTIFLQHFENLASLNSLWNGRSRIKLKGWVYYKEKGDFANGNFSSPKIWYLLWAKNKSIRFFFCVTYCFFTFHFFFFFALNQQLRLMVLLWKVRKCIFA